MDIKFNGVKPVKELLVGLRVNLDQVVHYATLDSAFYARDKVQEDIPKIFDRPKPWTQKALRVTTPEKPMSKPQQVALGFKDTQGTYLFAEDVLTPHIAGGRRASKPFEKQLRRAGYLKQDEYVVHGRGAVLDKYGNIPGAQYSKMLSDLDAYTYEGAPAATSPEKRKYIFVRDDEFVGIMYAEVGGWKPVLVVVSGAPVYKPIFDFTGLGYKYFDEIYEQMFDKKYDKEIKKKYG